MISRLAVLGLFLAIFTPLPAGAAEPDPVNATVDEVLALPGYELRRVYVGQRLEGSQLDEDQAARLESLLRVLEVAEAEGLTDRTRLESLLRAAGSTDPDLRSRALAAVTSGEALPPGEATTPTRASSGRDWLSSLESGLGPIDWGASEYELRMSLGDRVDVQPITSWEGPRYPDEQRYVTFSSSIGSCTGDFALFVGREGFSRVWFETEDAACWLILSDLLERRRGPAGSSTVEDGPISVRMLRWDTAVPIKLAVEGDGPPRIFLNIESPLPAPSDPYRDVDESSVDLQASTKAQDRLERGRRLRGRGIGFGASGLAFWGISAATGIALLSSPEADDGPRVALAATFAGTGVLGGTFVAIGAGLTTHGNILIRRSGLEASLRFSPSHVALAVTF